MKTPRVGQTLKWIKAVECDSRGNRNFVKAQRRKYPGKLKIAALVEPPSGTEDKHQFHVSHNGTVIMDETGQRVPSQFSPYWFKVAN